MIRWIYLLLINEYKLFMKFISLHLLLLLLVLWVILFILFDYD